MNRFRVGMASTAGYHSPDRPSSARGCGRSLGYRRPARQRIVVGSLRGVSAAQTGGGDAGFARRGHHGEEMVAVCSGLGRLQYWVLTGCRIDRDLSAGHAGRRCPPPVPNALRLLMWCNDFPRSSACSTPLWCSASCRRPTPGSPVTPPASSCRSWLRTPPATGSGSPRSDAAEPARRPTPGVADL